MYDIVDQFFRSLCDLRIFDYGTMKNIYIIRTVQKHY